MVIACSLVGLIIIVMLTDDLVKIEAGKEIAFLYVVSGIFLSLQIC
jgi:hypothetical protein